MFKQISRNGINFLRKLARRTAQYAGLTPRQSFALNQLDVKLASFLNFRQGVFVELGANDGITQSNTLYFERYLGWRGLLIEAIPALAEQCRINRPQAIVHHCACIAADYPNPTVEMRYSNLMSVVKGGLQNSELEERHLSAGRQHLRPDETEYVVSVPAQPLSAVLDIHQIRHIDLLSLDVEGYEGSVLRGLDFSRHAPKHMLIEVRDRAEIDAILTPHYRILAILQENPLYSDILYRRLQP
jgi:FkbM family methyltransferase